MRHAQRLRVLGVCAGLGLIAGPAAAATITLTALVSDRGIDLFPRDGTFDSVFGDPSVVQITTPPAGDPASEERTAIEFSLAALLPGIIVNGATLQLSPQSGNNLGLGAGETGEVHGYIGNGGIEVADLMASNLVGSIAGPSPNGPVAVPIAAAFIQSLVDADSDWAGLMFKGLDGPAAVTFSFAGTFGGIPADQRPQLTIDYTEAGPVVPEPGSLLLLSSGLGALFLRRRAARGRAQGGPAADV